MKNKTRAIFWNVYIILLISFVSWVARADFLPPNDLFKQDNVQNIASMSRSQFESILGSIATIYRPIFAKHGLRLSVTPKWNESSVNASTHQIDGTVYIDVFGGLARRTEITRDGLAMIMCHEIGHSLAGYPLYPNSGLISNEGQSDYYATQVCAKRLWYGLGAGSTLPDAGVFCRKYKQYPNDIRLCERTILAGFSAADLMATLENVNIAIYTPSKTVVGKTFDSHPDAQCRLDTYVAGAICPVGFNDNVIPANKQTALLYSCSRSKGFSFGNRPQCWYKE